MVSYDHIFHIFISNNKIQIKSLEEFLWEWFGWDADIDNPHMVSGWVTVTGWSSVLCLLSAKDHNTVEEGKPYIEQL